jgi:hypothetical protein
VLIRGTWTCEEDGSAPAVASCDSTHADHATRKSGWGLIFPARTTITDEIIDACGIEVVMHVAEHRSPSVSFIYAAPLERGIMAPLKSAHFPHRCTECWQCTRCLERDLDYLDSMA